MTDITVASEWGFFALVSYLRDPLRSFFYELRQALPGEENPQPHITILPPRPLMLPVEAASRRAREILLNFPAFEVELSQVRCFPETNVLYFDVGDGCDALHALHTALNSGDLSHTEEFAFRPHLTLSGPVPPSALHAVQQQAETAWHSSGCSNRFLLSEVVCLWVRPEENHCEWQPLWSQSLPGPEVLRTVASASTATTQRY
jgi:hypothetical protein